MCDLSVIQFFVDNIKPEEFQGKRVLEVGSKYVNGSVRPIIERFFNPKEYIGIDIEPGKFVDIVLPAQKIIKYFNTEQFDVLISTELLEHVRDWRLVITNMKKVLKKGGYIYISTRSKGFVLHDFPFDWWRYEKKDIKQIFSDFDIIELKRDYQNSGVFLKAKKPLQYKPCKINDVALYSIIRGKRINYIPEIYKESISQKIKHFVIKILRKIENGIKRMRKSLT